MAENVTVGIDIGTSSVKAVAADDEGNIVAMSRVAHELASPEPGLLQHDARRAWVDGPRDALAQLGVSPAAICVNAMVPALCPVDADGLPIGPGLLYGDDRGAPTDHTLPPGQSGEAAGFLSWLAGEHPNADAFWPAQAVANAALLEGCRGVDLATAVSLAPLFGVDGWSAEVFEAAGAPAATAARSPELVGIGESVGTTAEGAVLASGLVDAMGEQIVAGANEVGDALVMCGTTMLTWAVVPDYVTVEDLWTLPHLTRMGQFLIGGPSNAGGLFLDWVRRLVGGSPGEVDDPGRVPVWAPYPRGERTPLHDPGRRADLVDLDLTHGAAHVMQAAYEAAGFVVRHHLDLSGADVTRIVASGGGTQDPRWMQALADCTGLPVDVVAVPQGAALGSAWVARMAAGLETELGGAERWAGSRERVEPRPGWTEAADVRYRRFRSMADG